jgi:nitroreductase
MMELYEVMRTTFSAREFTAGPISNRVIYKILENARFAPSGGNRQAGRVIIIRNEQTRKSLAELCIPGAKRYTAQIKAGETPWNSVNPSTVSSEEIENTEAPEIFSKPMVDCSVVLVVCADLEYVASTDQDLERIGVVSGASIYPFVWNILLAARHEGYGGTISTMAVPEEQKIKALLNIPETFAVCAVIPLGKPVKQLTKLRRNPVSSFTALERWGDVPLEEE